jgi:predicted ATPase
MVAINSAGTTTRYRLLDTTRDYVLAIRIDEAEFAELAARHATYYRQWLEQTEVEQPTSPNAPESTPQPADLGNVRSALEWCFGDNGNVQIGVGLAAAATPMFLAKSLLAECYRWSERALLALDDAALGGRDEMRLRAALGMSLMFMRGESEAVLAALNRSLSIAEAHGDALTQLSLLGPLRMFHSRIADFKVALLYAKRASAVSRTIGDPTATTLAHSMLGGALYFAGDLGGARMELEAALKGGPGSQRTHANYLGFGGHDIAGMTLAMTLWLLGYPAQAVERAHQTLEEAARINHPVTLSVVLIWGIHVFLWTGDLENAERHIERFVFRAESYSLGPYLAVGRGFKGQLAILRGDAKVGVESLQACLADLHAARYGLLNTPFNISLVQGLAATGQFADSSILIDETIRHVEANGEHCYMPELLRVKGNVLVSLPRPARDEAEMCFRGSLDLSRRQAARSWELRTAIDLAASLRARGQAASAEELLRRVFEQFSEGLDTADLKAAERLLATFS